MSNKTTSLNLSLPQSLKQFVEDESEHEGYVSASEYIRELLRWARRQRSRHGSVEQLLLEGVDSGECLEVGSVYFRDKRQKLAAKWQQKE